jgi:cell division protein FtsI (penicillin-binding protein 3)
VADRQLVGALVGAQSTSRAATSGSTTRTATIPAQRAVPSIERGRATGRAYARREDRLRKVGGGGRAPRNAATAGRAKFVLLIMGLLAVGLIVTLWLSTAAAADSYRLQDARVAARALSEQSEQLRREVTAMDAAPALAQRAASLGMVPVQDSARLVVAPDGAVTLAGTPKAAIATAPPPPPVPVVAPNGTTPSASATATPSAAPGADPNTPTADAAAAAGAAAPSTTAATPTPAPNGQADPTSTTATPRAGAATSAPATSTAAAAAASRTPAAAANAARTATATPTPKPTAAARTTAPAAGTAR